MRVFYRFADNTWYYNRNRNNTVQVSLTKVGCLSTSAASLIPLRDCFSRRWSSEKSYWRSGAGVDSQK